MARHHLFSGSRSVRAPDRCSAPCPLLRENGQGSIGKADVRGYLHTSIVQPHYAILVRAAGTTPAANSKEDRHDSFGGTSNPCWRLLLGCAGLLRRYPGVISTRVGYTGGEVPNATYRNHGNHAEAIEITFDPAEISYRKLLEFFFQIHDPTTLNRQGNDRGASYRSAIFYTNDEQKRIAEDTIADVDASGLWPGKVVTEIAPAGPFWQAEPEHQDYLERYPDGYTCHFIRPTGNCRRRPKQRRAASGFRQRDKGLRSAGGRPRERGRRVYLRHSRRREPRCPGFAAAPRRSSSC